MLSPKIVLLASLVPFVALGACSNDDAQEPSTSDAGTGAETAPTMDAGTIEDAAPDATEPVADASIPALGSCTFSVDGASYSSIKDDPFTLATLTNGDLTVQCVAITGGVRYTINLAASKVTGAGPSAPGLAQLSEQPATGGSPTQYRNFATPIDVAAVSASAVSGSVRFTASGKNVSVAFHLAL